MLFYPWELSCYSVLYLVILSMYFTSCVCNGVDVFVGLSTCMYLGCSPQCMLKLCTTWCALPLVALQYLAGLILSTACIRLCFSLPVIQQMIQSSLCIYQSQYVFLLVVVMSSLVLMLLLLVGSTLLHRLSTEVSVSIQYSQSLYDLVGLLSLCIYSSYALHTSSALHAVGLWLVIPQMLLMLSIVIGCFLLEPYKVLVLMVLLSLLLYRSSQYWYCCPLVDLVVSLCYCRSLYDIRTSSPQVHTPQQMQSSSCTGAVILQLLLMLLGVDAIGTVSLSASLSSYPLSPSYAPHAITALHAYASNGTDALRLLLLLMVYV